MFLAEKSKTTKTVIFVIALNLAASLGVSAQESNVDPVVDKALKDSASVHEDVGDKIVFNDDSLKELISDGKKNEYAVPQGKSPYDVKPAKEIAQSKTQSEAQKAVPAMAKSAPQPVATKAPRPADSTAVADSKSVKTESKPVAATKDPYVISQEEQDYLNRVKQEKKAEENNGGKKPLYIPAPTESGEERYPGFAMERDSSKVVSKKMAPGDSATVKMCFGAGLQVVFDDDITTDIQRAILDDNLFFSAVEMENKRGVYVHMTKPIQDGYHWESALRLVRKSDDKAYLINLVGVSCPKKGSIPFPKILYIRDHFGRLNENSKVMSPEDTIIYYTDGLPRVNRDRIRVPDMVASSSSNWVVFSVEVQYPEASQKTTVPQFRVLDNLQVNLLDSKIEYLPLHSKKATEKRGVPTLRFRLMVNINKDYIVAKRFIHLIFLDKEAGHHQYVRIDTLPYLISLQQRGFDL